MQAQQIQADDQDLEGFLELSEVYEFGMELDGVNWSNSPVMLISQHGRLAYIKDLPRGFGIKLSGREGIGVCDGCCELILASEISEKRIKESMLSLSIERMIEPKFQIADLGLTYIPLLPEINRWKIVGCCRFAELASNAEIKQDGIRATPLRPNHGTINQHLELAWAMFTLDRC